MKYVEPLTRETFYRDEFHQLTVNKHAIPVYGHEAIWHHFPKALAEKNIN